MEDSELIKGCVSGDKRYWDAFVEQYSRLIYDSIIRTFKKFGVSVINDVIDDLFNDVFLALLKDQCKVLREFEGRNGCTLASYLRTISVRRTIDCWRKQRPTISIEQESDTENGNKLEFIKELIFVEDHDSLFKEDAINIVNLIFAQLEKDEQRFCELCFIENKDPLEISSIIGISVDNFYVRKQRMLDKLRRIAKDKKIC